MQVGIITVGDELLAGDVENTNATWLARELTDRGVSVRRVSTIPDDEQVIQAIVKQFSDAYDGVIVTGGLGGTPDDVTMDGVAAGFGCRMVVNEDIRRDVVETLERIRRERRPGLTLDIDAEAAIPAESQPLINPEGISPGCIIENVFVLPGIPREMKAMFHDIADTFTGNLYSETAHTDRPESHIIEILEEAQTEFGVSIGCYPNPNDGSKRIKITGSDKTRVSQANDWLSTQL